MRVTSLQSLYDGDGFNETVKLFNGAVNSSIEWYV